MPPATLWEQYAIVGILILAAGAIAAAFYKLWHELLDWLKTQDSQRIAWISEQDKQREIEREKQRVWESEQNKIRDQRWQEFLKSMQDSWIAQDGRHTEALETLIKKVDELINEVRQHDTWARAKDSK